MLIIAALNLPATAKFESKIETQTPESQKGYSQSSQSLVRTEPVEPEPTSQLPFDFSAETDDSQSLPSLSSTPSVKTKPAKPKKSIVDERVPISTLQGSTPLSQNTSMLSSGNASPARASADDSSRTVELVQRQLQRTSINSSLKRMSSEDDDVKLEHERIAKAEQSGDSASINSMGSRLKRSASHISIDNYGNEFLNMNFHLDVSKASNRGLFNALSNAIDKGDLEGFKAVGTLGMNTDVIPDQTKREISEALLMQQNCHAVYISDAEREGHYDQYCKEFLWPTFHCQIPDIPTSKAYEEHSWGYYVKVNRAIANKVCEVYKPGDIVWVHDYHLMLVPEMVRQKHPRAAIGFFLHIAFPSSEVFRCLAYRTELLSGVLASNSIAFHIPEYAQHFKMSLARLLAVDITAPGVIETTDHDAFITHYPLGIDVGHLERILDRKNPNSAVQQHRKVIRQRWPHQRLIAARDKVDPVRGLPQKLRAFDQFLSENPQWTSKVVLVQICNSGEHVFQSSGIESLVDQINSKYGDIKSGVQPVVLLKQDIVFEQYLALLSEADGFCVSCLRDGMNLTSHEYVYCNDSSRMGPLILSEFTGSASVLGEQSLLINPWNQDQLAQAFKKCLEMPRWERHSRWEMLRSEVLSHPAAEWATKMTKHIYQSWQDEISRTSHKPNVNMLREKYHSVTSEESRIFLLEVEPAFTDQAQQRLNEERGGHREGRHMSFDREVTYRELSSKGPYYTDRLTIVLRDLCSDPRNIVYVTSAESKDHMERFYRSLPGLGLISEFGRSVRPKDSETWIDLSMEEASDWRDYLKPWLKLLRERSVTDHIAMHDNSIIVKFKVPDDTSEDRDLSTVGEYISLLNDHYARELGVRTKLEDNILALYRSTLGVTRKRAFEKTLQLHQDKKLGLLMMATQPYATEADDVIYDWAETVKTNGRTKELITTVVGQHPSHAHCMVEGTNALLNLLQSMRNKESESRSRPLKAPSFR